MKTNIIYITDICFLRTLHIVIKNNPYLTIFSVLPALPDHGPTITGSRLRYQIGDRVQVNCTSGRSRPATRLAWYINGEPAPPIALVPPTHEKHEDGLETTSLALDFKVKPKHFRKGDLKLKVRGTKF